MTDNVASAMPNHFKKATMPLHNPLRPTALATLAFIACAAQAQTPEAPYFYLGAGVGQARPNIDAPRLGGQALAGRELTITGTSHDARDTAYKVFGGYQLNRYFGIEGGYVRLGHFSYQATTSPAGQLDGRLRVTGLNLDLVGSLPFSDSFSGLARVGYQKARTRADWASSGAVTGANGLARSNMSEPRYGVGLQYAVTPQFLLRAEAERSRFADALGGTVRASVYTVSAVMPMGSVNAAAPAPRSAYLPPAAPPVAAAPAPMPVAVAAPAPIVMPAPVPAAVPLRRVSFTAESLFGFDSAALQPAGKTALDTFAGELAGTRFDSIAVTGHTDRLGSTAYNQALSLQRADAVKAYLVASAGLEAGRISAQGRSELEPVTQPGDCKGRSSPRVIACLQPDRRVEIQVSGTR